MQVCNRGPGQFCDGGYGPCDEGLVCSTCNRCEGCSFKTFTCWQDTECYGVLSVVI